MFAPSAPAGTVAVASARPRPLTVLLVVALLSSVLVVGGTTAAHAGTNPAFSSSFSMIYRVFGSTHFTVIGNGKVPVRAKATTGATNKGYTIAIQRQSCGTFTCSWSVVGSDKSYTANGSYQTRTWEFGNSSSKHRLRLTKLDDGKAMNGTARVGLD